MGTETSHHRPAARASADKSRERGFPWYSENVALPPGSAALTAASGVCEGCAGSVFKNLTDTLSSLCGALNVAGGANALANFLTLLGRDRLLTGLVQLLNSLGVETEILLAPNEDDWKARAEVKNFGNPLFLDVVKRVRGVNGEADQNDVRVWVRQRTQTVIILLTGSIP